MMVNIRGNGCQKAPDPPTVDVGGIDTRAPFQSVKAAVSLFGEVATTSGKESTPWISELCSKNVLDKETELMMVEQEFDRIRKNLESSELEKERALADLEMAHTTMADLIMKIELVNKSKQSTIEAKEAMKQRVAHLEIQTSSSFVARNLELERTRKQYLTTTAELHMAKQELASIRQDFNIAMEAKLAAIQWAEEAQLAAWVNSIKVSELSKEISNMKKVIQQLELVAAKNQQEQAQVAEEKGTLQQTYATALKEAEKRLETLKQEHDPEITRNLEAKLAEVNANIKISQEEMKQMHASEMNTVKDITNELNEATSTLQQVADEESSLQRLVNYLRVELEDVRREHRELKEKEAVRLAIEEEKRVDALEESLKVEQMLSEAANAKREAEEMNKIAAGLKQEAEATLIVMHAAQKQLQLALAEVENAKAAEKRTLSDMKILTEKHEAQIQECSSKIKISLKEYKSLKARPEESEKLVEAKFAAVSAQLEAINTSRIEADKKLEANLKALEEIEAATDKALRSARIAEAAHSAVDAELKKWKPLG